MCRTCWPAEAKGWGDSVSYLLHFKHMTYPEALQELGLPGRSSSSLPPIHMTNEQAPPQKWQEMGELVAHLAEKWLWGKEGRPARDYLVRRGFSLDVAREARLGYLPPFPDAHDLKKPGAWGMKLTYPVSIPSGILIPIWYNGDLWKLLIRRKIPDGHDGRYQEIEGSRQVLWGADSLQGKTAVLYEGVFDALSGKQAYPQAAHVATDGTKKCRSTRWIARLAEAAHLLIAYDNDEAGEKGSVFWCKTIPSALRWTPWGKDANDMLVKGDSVATWIDLGIASALARSRHILPLQPQDEASTDEWDGLFRRAEAAGFPAIGDLASGEDAMMDFFANADILAVRKYVQLFHENIGVEYSHG